MKEYGRVAEIKPESKKEKRSSRMPKADFKQPSGSLADRVLFLQRTIGNRAVEKLLRSENLQAKLRIGQPGDVYEREADRVAEEVMRMREPCEKEGKNCSRQTAYVQRKCPKCEKDEEIQRQLEDDLPQAERDIGSTHEVTSELEENIKALSGGGQPLPESVRAFFEPRFGYDFSQVRVHTDAKAAESAQKVNAQAYTVGDNIVFGFGHYAPGTQAGNKLLAHELAHTIQQVNPGNELKTNLQRTIGDGHDLQSPRLAGNVNLEAAFDNELLIQKGSRGPAVRLIQESLLAQGYTLPGFGADGDFGAETKAAVLQFQSDAGAVKKDGIVGPETMGLLDIHDPSLLTGIGPVAKTGPVPGPRPAPAAGCDAPYTGVTFTLANQTGSGVSPAAIIRIARVGGRDFLQMRAIAHANYRPDVTINAPNNAKAQEFQVGFISNLLTETLRYDYSTGAGLRSTLPTPIKDGRAVRSGLYDTIYVEQLTPSVLENFTAAGAIVHLNWPDVPSDGAFINLLDNPECVGPLAAATMTNAVFRDSFRTWVAVRHRLSGCVKPLHHIDWDLDWSAAVNMVGGAPTVAVINNIINVSEPNGDATPRFIQGGQVPDDLLAANRVCP